MSQTISQWERSFQMEALLLLAKRLFQYKESFSANKDSHYKDKIVLQRSCF